jgi:hypothetical protein
MTSSDVIQTPHILDSNWFLLPLAVGAVHNRPIADGRGGRRRRDTFPVLTSHLH